jgi:leucyl-tRNA synthetase
VRHCQIFLKRLYGYAERRLREWSPPSPSRAPEARIDTSEKLRRRLANWCRVACAKVTENYERLELQRAAHNAMLLFTRIQDFEQRAQQRDGELEPADREAVVAALLLLVQLLAPLTPHLAEELWSLAGHTSLVSDAPWPVPERPTEGRSAADRAAAGDPTPAKRGPTPPVPAKRDPAPPATAERDFTPAARAPTGGGDS